MLATAPIMVVESKMATTDALLTLLLTSCQVALWTLNRGPSKLAAAVFWAALALSVLTKGPVGVALVAAAGLVSWAVRGPSTCWYRLHWKWGLPGFAIVTLPWFLAIGIMTRGEFFRVAVGQQIVTRVIQALEEHGGFPGYYLVTTLLTFYPWSTLLPVALLGAWVCRRSTPDLAVLLGWVIGPLILLECVRTKLVHYYLPAYPACALLTAWLVETLGRAGIDLSRCPLGRVGLGTFAALGAGLTVALVHLSLIVLPRPIAWPCLAVAVVVAVGHVARASGCFRSGQSSQAAWTLVGTWAVVLLILGAWLVPAADPYRISTALGPRMAALLAREGAEPITADYKEPSLIVSLGRPAAPLLTRTWLIDQVGRHRQGRHGAPVGRVEPVPGRSEDRDGLERDGPRLQPEQGAGRDAPPGRPEAGDGTGRGLGAAPGVAREVSGAGRPSSRDGKWILGPARGDPLENAARERRGKGPAARRSDQQGG